MKSECCHLSTTGKHILLPSLAVYTAELASLPVSPVYTTGPASLPSSSGTLTHRRGVLGQ